MFYLTRKVLLSFSDKKILKYVFMLLQLTYIHAFMCALRAHIKTKNARCQLLPGPAVGTNWGENAKKG